MVDMMDVQKGFDCLEFQCSDFYVHMEKILKEVLDTCEDLEWDISNVDLKRWAFGSVASRRLVSIVATVSC